MRRKPIYGNICKRHFQILQSRFGSQAMRTTHNWVNHNSAFVTCGTPNPGHGSCKTDDYRINDIQYLFWLLMSCNTCRVPGTCRLERGSAIVYFVLANLIVTLISKLLIGPYNIALETDKDVWFEMLSSKVNTNLESQSKWDVKSFWAQKTSYSAYSFSNSYNLCISFYETSEGMII